MSQAGESSSCHRLCPKCQGSKSYPKSIQTGFTHWEIVIRTCNRCNGTGMIKES